MELDPRAQTKVSVETVNGVITDRAMELLGMLNNAIGAEGQIGTQKARIILNGEERTQVLGNHLIAPDAEEAQWKVDERVYFQTSHTRIDQVADELQESLDSIKDDIVENIGDLFNTLKTKESNINVLEKAVATAKTTKELLQAQKALEVETTKILTSDEALDAMVTIFFKNYNLTLERIDSEIFDKLHDFDGDYANGASDIKNEKFFFQRGYSMSGDIPGETKPAIILDTVDDVFDMYIKDQKIIHENQYGAGTYTQGMANYFVENEVAVKFAEGDLALSDEIIEKIIEKKGLKEKDLANITEMKEFLNLVSFGDLLQYTGISNRQQAINALFKDHLQETTAKYYEDQRTIFDILNGKNNNVNSGNAKDMIFSSVDTQMKNVAQGVSDLMENGYSKVANSNLQIAIRNNPFAAIEYLEAQRDKVGSAFKELLDEQIDVLISRQVRHLKNYAEDLVQERTKMRLSGKIDQKRLDEINNLISNMADLEVQIRQYNSKQNANTRKRLDAIFPSKSNIEFDAKTLNYKTFTNSLDPEAKYTRASKLLYTMENTEAGQKNAEYYTKKLPEPRADGSVPEETRPVPPLLAPTTLSVVIAKIGDELVDKSKALINGDGIPTTKWMANNTSTLITINEKLSTLDANSSGDAFIKNLKKVFKNVIKDFFETNASLKAKQDSIKDILESTIERRQELTALDGNGFDLDSQTLATNLNKIENGLNGNIKSGSNFINKAGLEQTKQYLTQNINALDDVNYDKEINQRLNEIERINDKIRNGSATKEDRQRLAQLRDEVKDLRRDENNLEKAQELLYGKDGNSTKPSEDSALELFKEYNKNVNRLINQNGGLKGKETRADFLDRLEETKTDKFKDVVQNYSDSLTNFEADKDKDGESDILSGLRDSLDKAKLDLDGNGRNDFVDIQNMVDKLDELSENITDTFGSKNATEGGINKQGIRRLLLMMFVFSMLESSDWQFRQDDTNVDRYIITP